LLALDLEVLHLLAGFLELSVIWDGDDGSPEWASDVLSDLGSALEGNASTGFERLGDLLGVNGVLGEVVKVDKVLFISGLHHFCGFFFFVLGKWGGFVYQRIASFLWFFLFCIRKVGWFCFLYRG